MIIWFALVLPLLSVPILYWKWSRLLTWWEVALQLAVPCLLVAISKGCVETSQTDDVEYWGGYITKAQYYEPWDEEVDCSHPKYKTVHKTRRVRGSDGKMHTEHYTEQEQIGWLHSYDVVDHGPRWIKFSSLGGDYSISQPTYKNYVQVFGNEGFLNLQHRRVHSYDGNMYEATWKGEPEKIEPVTVQHTYENRVQASHSVFKFPKVNPADHGLFEYPPIDGLRQQAVLGNQGEVPEPDERRFEYLNATLGSPHQVRLYLVLFHGKPMQAALDQESYWKGGNKNELVTCVGLGPAKEIQWCYVFSWTEVDILKVEARNFVMGQKTLDLGAYAVFLEPLIKEKWRRKHFKDFSYLTVDPPMSAVITIFIVTALVSAALSFWAIWNELVPNTASWSFETRIKEDSWK